MSLTNIFESSVFWFVVQAEAEGLTKPGGSNVRTLTFNKNVATEFYTNTATDTWDVNDIIFDNFRNMCNNTVDVSHRLCRWQVQLKEWATSATAVSYRCSDTKIEILFYWAS